MKKKEDKEMMEREWDGGKKMMILKEGNIF